MINHSRKEEKGRENKKGKKNQNELKEGRRRTYPHRICLSHNDSNKDKNNDSNKDKINNFIK